MLSSVHNQGIIILLILGKDQYKHDVTFKEVLLFFKDVICEKTTGVLLAISTFLLGLINESLNKAIQLHTLKYFSKTDIFIIITAILLIIFSIFFYFRFERPQKETVKKYRKKNIKLKNNYYNHIKVLREKQLRNHEIDIQIFWHDILSVISKAYDFTSNERLSLFVIQEDTISGQELSMMIGRYSENYEYNKKNRGIHPINQGCIGAAWNSPENYFFKNDFPEQKEKYDELLSKEYKFTKETIANFRMKAKTIGCTVLHNLTNTDKVAVLVFESIDKHSKILTEEIMMNIYEEYKNEFQNLIANLKDEFTPVVTVDSELEAEQ